MYNDTIIIFVCVFAVYGVYSVIREIFMLLGHKEIIAAAIRMSADTEEHARSSIVESAEHYISEHAFLERRPIIICETTDAEYFKELGYAVYIKYTEETWSNKTIR